MLKYFFSKATLVFVSAALTCGAAYYSFAKPGNFFLPKSKPEPQHRKLDLKVSSVCQFNGALCQGFGNWEEADLNCRHKFFNFPDLKPGDYGEVTIDLTVTGGDACGEMTIKDILDRGNKCVEPETKTRIDRDCRGKNPGSKEKNGEMRESIEFQIWLDQGRILGFQGKTDPGEGDNIYNEKDALMMDWTSLRKCPKTFELRKFLRTNRQKYWNDCQNADGGSDILYRFCLEIAGNSRQRSPD